MSVINPGNRSKAPCNIFGSKKDFPVFAVRNAK